MSVSAVASQARTAADAVESGRVLANLNDWRAMTWVLVVVIAMLLLERVWARIDMRIERKQMHAERQQIRELAKDFADSANKTSDALAGITAQMAVMQALSARAEAYLASVLSKARERLDSKDHPDGER